MDSLDKFALWALLLTPALILLLISGVILRSAAKMFSHLKALDRRRKFKVVQNEADLSKLYPRWKCSICGDWFHMPYKYCKCDKKDKK